MSFLILREASSIGPKHGFLAWWRENGCPAFIMITDPPYHLVSSYTHAARRSGLKTGQACKVRPVHATSTEISYGSLTPNLRKGIAMIAAEAEWSAIYGMIDDLGNWRRALDLADACWLGCGLVKQAQGAPRIRGDGPGIRHLGLALSRRRRAGARWNGRSWGEWVEYRDKGAKKRPIPGTRSMKTIGEMIDDMVASCDEPPIVVDPCAGTGVTLMAAKLRGLAAIGWEKDPKTHAYAARVIAAQGHDDPNQVDMGLELARASATAVLTSPT